MPGQNFYICNTKSPRALARLWFFMQAPPVSRASATAQTRATHKIITTFYKMEHNIIDIPLDQYIIHNNQFFLLSNHAFFDFLITNSSEIPTMVPFDITTFCELLCCIRADIVQLHVFLIRDTSSCFIDYRVMTQSPHTWVFREL